MKLVMKDLWHSMAVIAGVSGLCLLIVKSGFIRCVLVY